MELGPSQLWKAVRGKSTVPGQQELRLPRTALYSGLISELCERNVGSGSSDVPLKCGNIYLPNKADHNFMNTIKNNLKNKNSTVSQNFVIFLLHLTKLLVKFPGSGVGFIAPYQCSCTVVAIVGLVGEEVDVSTAYIQHIIKKTFNSTPVFCCWFGVWGGHPRKLWHIIHPVRVTCKYCNFLSWFWNTTHWQGTHYMGFQSSAVWCCVNGCVDPDISKVCSAFILKGTAVHEERLPDPWRWRHYVPLERTDHLFTISCRTGIEKQNGFVSFVGLYMLTEKHKMWIFHCGWMNDLSLT